MGPFLRVDEVPYVINLMLAARNFYTNPRTGEAFLRQHHISYVVARIGQLLGCAGPMGRAIIRALNAAPFLRPVLARRPPPDDGFM
jgi:hypothetical protein